MDIHEQIELQSCPYCGGAAMLEEEHGSAARRPLPLSIRTLIPASAPPRGPRISGT